MIISSADRSETLLRSSHAPPHDARRRKRATTWRRWRRRRARRTLPPELACLVPSGVPLPLLETAAARARSAGTTGDMALLASRAIDEDAYYRRVARHLDVRFETEPPALDLDAPWGTALRSGVVRCADGGYLMAPRGSGLRLLIERAPQSSHKGLIALTTPGRFSDAVLDHFGAAAAGEASGGLAVSHADLSASSGSVRWQRLAMLATLAVAAAGAALGGWFWFLACAIFGLSISVAVTIRLIATAAACTRAAREGVDLADGGLPTYTVVVALYREARVVPRLIAALDDIDYPPEKLEIVFAIEESDEDTCEALRSLCGPAALRWRASILRLPDGQPRTKPRALNYALAAASGSLIVIFDAEDHPERDQLRKAAAAFAEGPPELACLQASLCIDNALDDWLTRLFAIDYAGLFDVLNPGLADMRVPLPLGGTSNHLRTQVLRDIGGWDAWNVTEDADLGLRLARLGYETRCLESTTWEEAPARLRNWMPQRRRWMKGWMQTLVTHTRRPGALVADLGFARAVSVLAILAANTSGPLVGPFFMAYVTYDMIAGDLLSPEGFLATLASAFWVTLALAGLLSLVFTTAVAIARRGLWSSAAYLVLRPVHFVLTSYAAWTALVELFRRPFHWNKTEHGLAETSVMRSRAKERA